MLSQLDIPDARNFWTLREVALTLWEESIGGTQIITVKPRKIHLDFQSFTSQTE